MIGDIKNPTKSSYKAKVKVMAEEKKADYGKTQVQFVASAEVRSGSA